MELKIKLTNPTYRGQEATAKIISVSGTSKRNWGRMVYRSGEFCLRGENIGWNLIRGEYRTLAGLIKAAKKIDNKVCYKAE